MAYSRWVTSDWYTFWCAHPRNSRETRLTAIFEICGVCQFTAKQLRDNIDECVKEAMEITDYEYDEEELKGYMKAFLADVDEKYPKKGKKK